MKHSVPKESKNKGLNEKEKKVAEKKAPSKKKAKRVVKPAKGKPVTQTDQDKKKEQEKDNEDRGKWRPKFFYRAYTTEWLPITISDKNLIFKRQKTVPRSDKIEKEEENQDEALYKYPKLKRIFEEKDKKSSCEIIDKNNVNDKKWPGKIVKDPGTKKKEIVESNLTCERDPNQLVIKQTSASGAAKKVVTQLSRLERMSPEEQPTYGPYSFYLLQRVQKPFEKDNPKDMTRVYLYSGSFVKYDRKEYYDAKEKLPRLYDKGKRNKKPVFNPPRKDLKGNSIPEYDHILKRSDGGVSVVERINSFTVPFTEFRDIKNAAKLKLLVPSTNFMKRFNYAKEQKKKSQETFLALWRKLKDEVRQFDVETEKKIKNMKTESARIDAEKLLRKRRKRSDPKDEEKSSDKYSLMPYSHLDAKGEAAPARQPERPREAQQSPLNGGEQQRKGGSTQPTVSLTKMKTSITKLMAEANQVKKELTKILKGKASLKRFKTIWSPEQLKRVRQVIKNLP